MDKLIKKIPLENGLIIYMYDHTRRYYGDFYRVKIEIVFEIPLTREYFENENEYVDAQKILGKSVSYRRFVEQMGVPSTGIERVQELLIQNFKENSIPYFSSFDFPRKFVLSHYDKSKKRFGIKVAR
jgi:hypothetical protein